MYLSAGSAMANSAEVSWLFLMKVEDFALTVRPTGRELVAFMAGNGETQLSLYTTACKNSVMRCWCGCLSGARCTLFAYGQADATAIPKTLPVLPHLNRDRFYLSGISLPRCPGKEAVKRV